MKTFFHEVLGYWVASLCALLVDAGILWSLVHYWTMDYLLAATISFVCGAGIAYVLSIRLAFRHHRLRDRRVEFASFVAIGVPGVAINAGVISVAVEYFGVHYMLAKCAATAMTFGYNFLARRQILFLRRRETT
jgi:putative flippase GtrA